MKEDLRAALIKWRKKLEQEKKSIENQIKACDTVFASLPPEPTAASEPPENPVASAESSPPPEMTTPALTPPPTGPEPSSAPAPPASTLKQPSAEELAELTALANAETRGSLMARVELVIIKECGDTFSLPDILKGCQKMFGGKGMRASEAISSALWKVVHKRRYRVIKPGRGTTPTLYGK